MILVVVAAARLEIEQTARWYEERRSGLGDAFLDEVDRALHAIARAPLASPRWKPEEEFRRRDLRRFPYSAFFLIEPARIRVLAVTHQKRRPGHWVGR